MALTYSKIHDLNHNPGLLPLKLGNAQNKIDHWTFIQIFDISNIINEFLYLQEDFLKIKNLSQDPNIREVDRIDFLDLCRSTETLKNKIKKQIYQLNPLNYKKLNKRGLVNGLGAIIKLITGNLDEDDAQKYENAIDRLNNNQIKIKTLIKDQITLLDKSINAFNNTIRSIGKNQKLISDRILKIENSINQVEQRNIKFYQFSVISMLISQLTTTFQEISDTLEKIEIAITFSKLNVFHNSMIDPNELLNEVKLINNHLSNNKLPFEPELQNILLFEKSMNIKSYSQNNKITFILEIPIVEMEEYDYYHLYSLPVIQNDTFFFVLPQSKFLALNDKKFIALENKCLQVSPEEFLCQDGSPMQIKEEDAPCEVQLLSYAKNVTNCQPVPVYITDTKIQKLENNKWIIVSPKNVVLKQKCFKVRENKILLGTFLLEIDLNCEIEIGGAIIKR